ncbi:hypothetical protein MP638_000690 [Amoeboaphelidium occidentale]|nr:hypothetical protein MP638_000690 [Amoeboaphelidium occidentale]
MIKFVEDSPLLKKHIAKAVQWLKDGCNIIDNAARELEQLTNHGVAGSPCPPPKGNTSNAPTQREPGRDQSDLVVPDETYSEGYIFETENHDKQQKKLLMFMPLWDLRWYSMARITKEKKEMQGGSNAQDLPKQSLLLKKTTDDGKNTPLKLIARSEYESS